MAVPGVALLLLALGAGPADTLSFATPATRALMERAMARHRAQESAVTDYRAQARFRVSFALGRRAWSRPPTMAVEEIDATVHWQAPNDMRVDLLGRRARARHDDMDLRTFFDADIRWLRAVTVEAPASDVWPWLAQMGRGAGYYSFDVIDNRRKPSAAHLISIPPPALGDRNAAIGELVALDDGRDMVWQSDPVRFLGASARMVLGYAIVPTTPDAYYDRYVKVQHLRRERTLPIFLLVFVCGLYLTGKVMAAGVGRFAWSVGEGIVHRMPIVRNVYAAVKQITDYIFNEQEVTFNRVVAVEWPRKGLWTIAFVTGEGFREIRDAAGEPILSLLVPTSPMPATGFTCTVPKSETIELDITIDQAVQFIVSCGVVVPPHQQWTTSGDRLKSEIEQQMRDSGKLAKPA